MSDDVNVNGSGRPLAIGLSVFALLHCAIAMWHGSAHMSVPVALTPMQTVFVGLVIILLPLAATVLIWTRLRKLATVLYAASMLASLLFGVINHYILISPDNVTCVPPGEFRMTFIVSAGLVTGSELIGTLLGWVAVRRWGR